jgi:hypothetical protein
MPLVIIAEEQVYYEPLNTLASNDVRSANDFVFIKFTVEDIQKIFSNLPMMYKLHQTLLEQLQACVQADLWDTCCVANIFLTNVRTPKHVISLLGCI